MSLVSVNAATRGELSYLNQLPTNNVSYMALYFFEVCPITRLILRDPVTAADGHTYDNDAISRWLASHKTSPKTGEDLQSTNLIPNHNLKRLIEDLLAEGGHGLIHQAREEDVEEEQEELVLAYEKTLNVKCLGPADSPFCSRNIRITKQGMSGGRKRQANGIKDTVIFTDATVSRRHFDIDFNEELDEFTITDLGSAGGTFLRVPFGEGKPIHENMMILVGKHQFQAIDFVKFEGDNVSVATQPEIAEGAEAAEQGGDCTRPSEFTNMDEATVDEKEIDENATNKTLDGVENMIPKANENYEFPLALRCFAPEGSPIQGNIFHVNANGSTIGRREQNDIALCHHRGDELLGLDSAVSGEHAHIKFDEASQRWMLYDGVESRPSTNGTWYRLSAMQEPSEPHVIRDKSEILIGTLRFVCKADSTLMER